MPLQTIAGDLFDLADTHILCHQCNCTSYKPHGLSQYMFEVFPFAHTYKKGAKRELGTISLHTDETGKPQVINMYAQYYVGRPKTINERYKPNSPLRYAYRLHTSDSYEDRKRHFQRCLDAMHATLPPDARVAFPYKIGCGLAGGVWEDYEAMIRGFVEREPRRDVVIVRRD